MSRAFSACFVIAMQSFREQWKNRFFQLVAAFAVIALYFGLILREMAGDQQARVYAHFGLGLCELVGMASAIYLCSTAVIRDMETKNIYLLLSRPVPRWSYVAGKFSGLTASVISAIACMGLAHAAFMLLRHYPVPSYYASALVASCLKAAVIGALAMFVSLFSTSVLSSVVMSFIFWTLGHFLSEARFIAHKLGGLSGAVLAPALYAVPNMALFGVTDALDAAGQSFAGWPALLGYCALYCGACLALSTGLFSRKEF